MPELVEWAADRRLGRGKFALHEDPMVDTASLEPPSRCSRWCWLRYDDVVTQPPPKGQAISAASRPALKPSGTGPGRRR